ncbi:hypothetical protein C8R43DRAFT_1118537 [Mycena crocata]|nr:hypothetical protein C8R43DRAFT_1143106 [Mycena crocata]KAJ7177551.1 hypothetical protein C8R43DRAFT_1118537 [Mycena crocata]
MAEVARISHEILNSQPRHFHTYKCILVGTQAAPACMVPVPARLGHCTAAQGIEDLDMSLWINPGVTSSSSSVDLDRCSYFFDRFPLDEPEAFPDGFYVVTAPQTSIQTTGSANVHPVNEEIAQLTPNLVPLWRGNVLAVKFDTEKGEIVDMADTDTQLVLGMIKRQAPIV